ncbi:hypothetical protein PFICI_07224 [Pestalotiopsis fici W106-1]|uniref:Mcm2 3 5 family protein n=1 Tax=Pestalotiopsis fici (strain W106-1 / CGMCC3.15140) TaxID=1229662 RepID=W3XA13_PESFW|nr:uncharacterized protein PFICI_07224 [Pestalotiopsis fici W106-1]ETS82222.1 hypothetical protein PFICI_07224 [Pestalotiopsis fici W106-1]
MAGYQHDEANGAPPNLLGTVFPGRYVYQRMDAAESQADVDMAELNSLDHNTTKGGMVVNSSVPMDPISPATVPNSRSGTSHGAEDVSPITPGQSEVAQSPGGTDSNNSSAPNAPAAAPAVRRPSRKSRFTELLRRSLSSSVSSNDGRTRSLSGFEPAREMTQQDTSYNPTRSQSSAHQLDPIRENEPPGNRDDVDNFSLKYSQAPLDCHSRRDVHVRRRSWLYIMLMIFSLYSTVLSGIWFVVAIIQPRYGKGISSSNGAGVVAPSTASLVTALLAKTTELTFVTVFVAFVGQVLTRRAFIKGSQGVTLAEMTMRNWIIQPGSLFTHWDSIPYTGGTFLGVLTLVATLGGIFYTTASDAMVTPKLIFGDWEHRAISGRVKASYANPYYVLDSCTTPINKTIDEWNAGPSCLAVYYSGQSYRNLLEFMATWQNLVNSSHTASTTDIYARPGGTALLYDNTTLYPAWVDGEYSDPAKQFATAKRVINNVSMSMPHPGIYQAATDPTNGILQPSDLSGVGEYQIRASVASPSVNVLCANLNRTELEPLIYATWPDARTVGTEIPFQRTGVADWMDDVPVASEDEWLNSTVVDDIFLWGEKYGRRPPVFPMYPIDYNMITNTSVISSDSIYILAKSGLVEDYTVCQLRSWLSPKCSTQFNISGIAGAQMRAHCEDTHDENAYSHSQPAMPETGNMDWKNMVDQWRLSMDLNGGSTNSNASNARILTNFILNSTRLEPLLPSMGEALAVLASSTLVIGGQDASFRQYWDASYGAQELPNGVYEEFNATIKMQQYASAHTEDWQAIFYPVLGLVFVVNVVCLLYLLFVYGMVTDYTEPRNMFALAVNSPPSRQLDGSCGGGPEARELVVPWRVGYAESANHYFFEEASDRPLKGKWKNSAAASRTSGLNLLAEQTNEGGRYRSSYQKLSASRMFL